MKAIDHGYIKTLHEGFIKTLHKKNLITIQASVPTVLAYLFTTYGRIETEVLRERKLKVHEMAYDLMDSLVTIYDGIKGLEHLCIAVANPHSQSQIVIYVKTS